MSHDKQKYLAVTDSSATEEVKEREHEIVVGGEIIPVKFKHGEPTILPFEQGVKFMKDGFTVREVDGKDLKLPPVAADNVVQSLKPNECVATYDELTLNALKMRAAQRSGGEIYLDAGEEDKDNLINFMLGTAPVEAESEDDFEFDPEGDVDELAAVEVSGLDQTIEATEATEEPAGVPVEESSLDTTKPVASNEAESNPVVSENAPETETKEGDEPKFTLEEVEGATDEAMRLAVENGIDINEVEGSGENGNVLVDDVQKLIDAKNTDTPSA